MNLVSVSGKDFRKLKMTFAKDFASFKHRKWNTESNQNLETYSTCVHMLLSRGMDSHRQYFHVNEIRHNICLTDINKHTSFRYLYMDI